MVRLALALCAVVALVWQAVPLPPIPAALPAAVRTALDARRRPIVARIDEHNGRIDKFNLACRVVAAGSAEHAACTQRASVLMGEARALDKEKAAFAAVLEMALKVPCTLIEGQLERDMDAMRRQQRTNELGFNELESWTKASQDAQKAAVMIGAKTLLGNVAKHLESQEKSASAFLGWLTRYEKAMRTKGVPFETLQTQVQTAMRGYVGARTEAFAGAALSKTLTLWSAWDTLTKLGGSIARLQAGSNADVQAALDDPLFKQFLNTESSGRDLARGLLNMAVKAEPTADLKKLLPAYGVLTFAIDYGYEASKWAAAYNRIVQQHKLADLQLKAVDALRQQIERTVEKLQACRASNPGYPAPLL